MKKPKTTFSKKKKLKSNKNSLKIDSSKGQIQLIVLLVLVVSALIILPISLGFAVFFLTKNIFMLLGAFLVVLGTIGLLWLPVPKNMTLILIYIGMGLIILPFIFEQLGGITLASMI